MKVMIAAVSTLVLWVTVPALADTDPPTVKSIKRAVVPTTYQGLNAREWAHRAVQARKDANARRRTIKRLKRDWRPSVVYAINLAAYVYGVSSYEMHRVASCESGHNPGAANGQYRGLFQEGPMFERGPFSRFGSVWDPLLNALTAAWTVRQQGWRQWSCRP